MSASSNVKGTEKILECGMSLDSCNLEKHVAEIAASHLGPCYPLPTQSSKTNPDNASHFAGDPHFWKQI